MITTCRRNGMATRLLKRQHVPRRGNSCGLTNIERYWRGGCKEWSFASPIASVREGRLDPALETYQFISSAYTLPVDRVRRLLDWLRGKSQQVFNQFQCALIENGCGDLLASEDAVV